MNNEPLQTYVDLLLKWQEKINLISNSTKNEIWERHITDSIQLRKFVDNDTKTLIDIGSGAGLPGIPIAIATNKLTYLVESDRKKCLFLEECGRQLNLNIKVINERIEKAKLVVEKGPVAITARALADLEKLFELIETLLANNNIDDYRLIIMKGKNVSRETSEAKKKWDFDFQAFESETNKEASILVIDKFTRKK